MDVVGFTKEEILAVYQLVSAILNLGNVDFTVVTGANGSDSVAVASSNGTVFSTCSVITSCCWALAFPSMSLYHLTSISFCSGTNARCLLPHAGLFLYSL